MRKWTRATTLLFMAAASVYPVGANLRAAERAAGEADEAKGPIVRLLDELSGPLAQAAEKPAVPADPKPADAKPAEAQPVPVAPKPAADAGRSEVSVSDAGTIDLNANEANLGEILRVLAEKSRKNIVASKDVRGTVTVNLYGVTVKEALDAVLTANGYGYREKGNFIYVYTQKELEELEKRERKMTTEVFRLHYTTAANAVAMIKPVTSPDAVVSFSTPAASGIETGGKDVGGNTHASEDVIIVRDYPDVLERVRKVMKEIDRRPQQVLVEATIVAARLNEDNALGVDFQIIGGVDFSQFLTPTNTGQINGATLEEATPAGRVRSVGTGNSFTQGIQDGFKVGLVTNNVAIFLAALEETTDTAILANPKVLTLNKQKGEVLVGREDGYLTTTVTESTAIQTVEFLQTGTRLIFRPYIAEDGYIRMEVHPEDSDGRVVQGLPSKTTTEVTTNVMVKDGHTIVIGGLFRESSTTSRSQVPGLGNLPIVGALFRNQRDATIREEIIILLTPHIVKDDRSYADMSEETLKDFEKIRVGVRKGMMFWGRERLAEACYESAQKEMNKPSPDRKKALWHLDCATNLNPKFIEATKMKESLTGHELSASDNSTIRSFVRGRVMAEKGMMPATTPVSQIEQWQDEGAEEWQPQEAPAFAAAPTTQPSSNKSNPEKPLLDKSEPAQAKATTPPTTQPVAQPKAEPTAVPTVVTDTPTAEVFEEPEGEPEGEPEDEFFEDDGQ